MRLNPFGKPKSTYEICRVECRGREVSVLGSHSIDEVRNDGSKEYTVSVPSCCYSEVAGALGSVLGRSVIPSEKKRPDGVNYSWKLSAKDYLSIATFNEKKLEMIARSQSPKVQSSNLSEEEINRMPSWRAEIEKASHLRFPNRSLVSSHGKEDWKPPSPDILDIGKLSEDTSY